MNLVALGSDLARVARNTTAVVVLSVIASVALTPALAVSAAGVGAGRYADMPAPAAMDEPKTKTATTTAATYAIGETTIRVRGTQRLYRFSSTSAITNERRVDFGLGAVFSSPGTVERIGDRNYIEITSGTWAGWWVAAPSASPSSVTRFSTPQAVRLSARDYLGVRFYASTNVRTRLAVTFNDAATFHADRKGSFAGRMYYHLTDGPLAGRWVKARALTLVNGGGSVTQPLTEPVAAWRGIVLIYPETDVTYKLADGSTYRFRATMTSSMKSLTLDVLERFQRSVRNWSGGLASLDLDIITVPHALTALDALGSGYWVGPRSVEKDLDNYAPAGKYDSIFVIWEHKNADGVKVPVPGWGLTLPPGSWSNGAGYTSAFTPSSEWWWTSDPAPEEMFIHEWMHQVIFFHEQAGRIDFDLHATSQYGYKEVDGSWKEWLSDVMQGKVWDGDSYIGVTKQIWAAGTPTNP